MPTDWTIAVVLDWLSSPCLAQAVGAKLFFSSHSVSGGAGGSGAATTSTSTSARGAVIEAGRVDRIEPPTVDNGVETAAGAAAAAAAAAAEAAAVLAPTLVGCWVTAINGAASSCRDRSVASWTSRSEVIKNPDAITMVNTVA